jgi:hypothetical protein
MSATAVSRHFSLLPTLFPTLRPGYKGGSSRGEPTHASFSLLATSLACNMPRRIPTTYARMRQRIPPPEENPSPPLSGENPPPSDDDSVEYGKLDEEDEAEALNEVDAEEDQ